MEPKLILVQSSKCQLALGIKDLYLELNLPATYRFPSGTLVRLHSTVGLKEEVYVTATFAERVPFGATFRQILAINAAGTLPGPWTRLESGFVSTVETIWLSRVDGQPFTAVPDDEFALLIEFLVQNG